MDKAFREVLAKKANINSLEDQSSQREQEIDDIGKDQSRLRENMTALKGTPEERELLRRYTSQMNTQEDRLAILHKEIAELKAKKDTAEDEFDQMLEKIAMHHEF